MSKGDAMMLDTGLIFDSDEKRRKVRRVEGVNMYVGIDVPYWNECLTKDDMIAHVKAINPQFLSYYQKPIIEDWLILEDISKKRLSVSEGRMISELAKLIVAYNRLTISRSDLNEMSDVGRPKTTFASLTKKGFIQFKEDRGISYGKGSNRSSDNVNLVTDIHPFYAFRGHGLIRDRLIQKWTAETIVYSL